MRRFTILFSWGLLVMAVGLVIYGSTHIPEPRFTGTLKELLPPPPPGWTMKEKPIADTPEMQEAVGEMLNFDDGVFVDYLGPGNQRLSVYIAYWTPGRMSHRLVAGHTPDVCWVGGGWKKTEQGQITGLTTTDGRPIPTGESRTFVANGTPEYVWFWHLVGNESKSYGTGGTAPWFAALEDLISKGVNQRQEQFFIRLSSSSTLTQDISPIVLSQLPWPALGQLK